MMSRAIVHGGHLIIHLSSSNNPARMQIVPNIVINQLYLNRFAIKGIPVTLGIPNSTHYTLKIAELPIDNEYYRNSGATGVPIILTGSYTAENYSPGQLISRGENKSLGNITVSLVDEDGNNAVFSEGVFWCDFN